MAGHPDVATAYQALLEELLGLRHAAGHTQREAADLIGTTSAVLCKWEKAAQGMRLLSAVGVAAAYGKRLVLVDAEDMSDVPELLEEQS